MHKRHNPAAASVSRARNLVAQAALEVQQQENVAGPAFCQLTALLGMLARLKELAQSCDPDVEAMLLDAATVCREAEILLRSIHSGGTCPMGGPWGRTATTSVHSHAKY
jgi:hypothetical protein